MPPRRIPGFWCLCLALGTIQAAPPQQGTIPMDRVLTGIGKAASKFWGDAPDHMAKEVWRQKTTSPPPRLFSVRMTEGQIKDSVPREIVHEIVSLYALGPYYHAPESLWEFRQVLSVDGKQSGDAAQSRKAFVEGLRGKDDKWRKKLRDRFAKQGAAGTLFDFGQILLLFTTPRQRQYTFEISGQERVGAENAVKVAFEQQLGSQSLRLTDRGKHAAVPLTGEILLRLSDYSVLQVRLNASHKQEEHEIRDETRVDYAVDSAGVILPASVVHKRFADGKADTEDLFEYSDWVNIRERK